VTATASATASAFDGSYAGQVTRKTGTTYGIRTAGYPVASTTSGHAYSATAEVRTAGATETLCQRMREYTSTGTLVAASSKCAAVAGAWAALPWLTYVAAGTGNRLRYEKAATAGDSFTMDSAVLTDDPVVFTAGTSLARPTTPATTTARARARPAGRPARPT
jgi:hypothetical protein